MGCITISGINLTGSQLLFLFFIAFSGAITFYAFFTTPEPFSNFDLCRSKGFSKEFCVQTPAAVSFPDGMCRCSDGRLGRYMPGWQGECVCPQIIHDGEHIIDKY